MRVRFVLWIFSVGAALCACSNEAGKNSLAVGPEVQPAAETFELRLAALVADVVGEGADQSISFRAGVADLIESAGQAEDQAPTLAELRETFSGVEAAGTWWRTIDGPAVITEPGLYRVSQDFTAAADGIAIEASWVVLWLGGHTLTGPGAKDGRGIVLDGAHHVVVAGGILENFGLGIAALNTSGSLVRNVFVQGADEFADPGAGNPPQIGVMLINSSYNQVSCNHFEDVNLGLFVRGGGSMYNRLIGNTVMGGQHGLLAICYNPAPGEGDAGPSRDLVKFNVLKRFGTGIQTSSGSEHNRFVFNTICYFNSPYEDFNGTNLFRHNRAEMLPLP